MLENFPFKCIKVLPTVYETSLSYYEVLCKVSQKLNEVIEELNGYDPEGIVNRLINERLDSYTESVVRPMYNASTQYTDIKVDDLDARMSQCCAEIKAQVQDLNARVTAFGEYLIAAEQRCKDYTDEAVAAVVYELPYVFSPVSGGDITVIDAIYELYGLARSDALTATEYDTAELTANEYAALDITAYQYDWSGKNYIE